MNSFFFFYVEGQIKKFKYLARDFCNAVGDLLTATSIQSFPQLL